MANTKQDFYNWVKAAYPGLWPDNMDSIDWTQPRYKVMVEEWKQLGYPPDSNAPTVPFVKPPAAPTTSKNPPEVVSSGGYDWIKTPDITGSGQDTWERIGVSKTDTTSGQGRIWYVPGEVQQDPATGKFYDANGIVEISNYDATLRRQAYDKSLQGEPDWQKGLSEAQLAEQKRQFDILQQQKASEFDKEQSLLPQRMALQWELDRQRLLAGLPSDDWVTRGIIENELKYANPYKPQPSSTGGGIDNLVSGLGAQLDRQTGQVQALQQIYVARLIGGVGDTEASKAIKEQLDAAQSKRDETYQAWSSVKKEAQNWSPQPPPRRQIYPNAPDWLPQWASNQVPGREITPQDVMTPSGQQLTAMPQSRANQIASYADWTAKMGKGRSWQDVLGSAELMQPNTPRGAGASRWSPARM